MEGAGQGLTAAVTHRELYPGRPQGPGHPQPGSGQRPGVQDSVAEQFAHYEGRVPDGGRKDATSTEFAAESPTGHADAGWHAREQHDARLTHLRARPAPWARSCQPLVPAKMPRRMAPETAISPMSICSQSRNTQSLRMRGSDQREPAIARFTVAGLATSANIG
jgi:hypothetical protein